jgi:type I restriction enzyme S subunit
MLNDWKFTTLGAEADLISGFPFRSNKYTDDPRDVRLLRGDNIVQGNIRWVNAKRWSIEDAPNFEQYELKKDDVVLAMDRPWIDAGLKYAAIDNDDLPCLLLQRTTRLRGGPNLDIRFLRYVIGSPEFTKHIQSITTGSLVPHISSRQIKDFVFRLPPLATQERIAAVLSALDAKIALNHQINTELEGMAKLLYDYWFVQYDFPLSAAQAAALGQPRLIGQPYRSSGGPMVFDPQLKREIPKGWEVGNLLDIATFTNGIACQKFPATSAEHLRVIKIKEMHSGFTETSEKVTTDVPEKVIVRDGDILFSWSASLEVMIWTGGTGALNQHIFKVTSENYPRSICYFTLKGYLQHFKMMADQRKTTMGHITREHLEQSRIAIPPKEIGNEFESITEPIFAQIINNHQQNQELTTLRDWLLPMLMNGQVRVG